MIKDNSKTLKLIKDLRTKGKITDIRNIIQLLSETNDTEIIKAISDFLNDIKQKKVVPIFIEAIKEEKFKNILYYLVSACWQSGLNFSEHIEVFINVFIKEEYQTALEAYTVIEEIISENIISKEDKNKYIESINLMLNKFDNNKMVLANELIKGLSKNN